MWIYIYIYMYLWHIDPKLQTYSSHLKICATEHLFFLFASGLSGNFRWWHMANEHPLMMLELSKACFFFSLFSHGSVVGVCRKNVRRWNVEKSHEGLLGFFTIWYILTFCFFWGGDSEIQLLNFLCEDPDVIPSKNLKDCFRWESQPSTFLGEGKVPPGLYTQD